jgi:integrase
MSLGKQAKILTEAQEKSVLGFLADGRQAQRNIVMFLLSVDEIRLQDKASKGKSGGVVFISKRLGEALAAFAETQKTSGSIIKSERGGSMSAQSVTNWFFNLYKKLGYEGCSSHSGRRTAITRWSRKISSVGGSLRDVQSLARHSSLQMTQRYIEVSEDAMRKVVG